MNALAGESSPYLLQHAENPVEWHPWGERALALAREQDRPILLSIGYSACHWCHVMAHESFEDAETAALMNRHFVNVKVDREERPDLDAVYMDAVVAMTGHGGWPMTVFLTPDGEPFYGGTYYPPEPRHGLPGFRQLLAAVAEAWRERRGDLEALGGRLAGALRQAGRLPAAAEPLTEELLEGAPPRLRAVYDPVNGGFGGAPKFPPAAALELLLQLHRRGGGSEALDMAEGTLDGMARGGMYDLAGGGFHRYSVDERWLVPHFEKMLYDNALLARVYLHAWALTGRERHRRVAEETLDYLLRELRLPGGGFASSQDADTDGVEGLTYVWTPAQLREVLGERRGAQAAGWLGVQEPGSFEGASVLRRSHAGEEPPELRGMLDELRRARALRPQPGRDDKTVAAWNGFALAALAEAGRRLERPDLLQAALDCAGYLLGPMTTARGRLLRSARDGSGHVEGYLDDYAAVALGLVELATATGDAAHLLEARRLADLARGLFADPGGAGFFATAADAEPLVARPRPLDDNPTPSGNSLMATLLLQLGRIFGEAELEAAAAGTLRTAAEHARRAPHGFGQMLCALDVYLSPPREVAVVGPPGDPATAALRAAVLRGFHPDVVYAFGDGSSAPVPLLAGRSLVDGRPAVYLCERFSCRRPILEPPEAAAALAA